MKRKSGEYGSSNSKKFVSNSHNYTHNMNTSAGMSYNQVQPPYNMSGELTANNSIHQTYYTNYTNFQYIVDHNQYTTYYQSVPPPMAPGMFHQPPPPPLPPDDSSKVKPPLPPGMPPNIMSPPPNNWNRKQNHRTPTTNSVGQRSPNPNNKFNNRFQKNQPSQLPKAITSLTSLSSSPDKLLDDITISKKSKRKPMSTRYTRKKEWDRDDAVKALALENEYNRLQKLPMLLLKFPDPELNKDIVKSFSSQIDNVHFQQPSTARYCYVTLRPDANVKEVEHEIGNIPFGLAGGRVIVKKHHHDERTEVAPEEIDPYTLYIGNLPTNVTVAAVKEKFPTAQRIDIGFAQKMKYTRYAFIRYQTVEESIEAFRNTFNLDMESRSLIVRFRRQKGNVGLPGETKKPKPKSLPMPESESSSLDMYNLPLSEKTSEIIQPAIEIEKCGANLELVRSGTGKVSELNEIEIIDSDKNEIIIIDAETNEINVIPELPPIKSHSQIDSVDSKANVLAEAMKLMDQQNSENINNPEAVIISDSDALSMESTENSSPTVKIKQEKTVDDLSDNIIGTQVKEEPEQNDDDDNEFEDEDDDDDGESEDEMTDDDDGDMSFEDKEEDDVDAALYDRFNHFPDLEFSKDYDEKEVKPNVEVLDLLHGFPSNGRNADETNQPAQNQSDYDDILANLNPNDNLEL